jgi:hypothetical protein
MSAPTVALVPAFRAEQTVAATVHALGRLTLVDEVLVIDDGSDDDTTAQARAAGAHVLALSVNRGKGGAVTAGVAARPAASTYLLIDADTGGTAATAELLLEPLAASHADLVIAVLPSAGARGGFGVVSRLAAWGVNARCGFVAQAPLSGQRAVRGPLLRSLGLAPRFGLEVGMTIDAVRAGARVVEVSAPFDHHHRGRDLEGFRHRARQGTDVVAALLSSRDRRGAGAGNPSQDRWPQDRWPPGHACRSPCRGDRWR